MNAKKFSDAMSELDTKYVDEALNYKTKMKKPIWINYQKGKNEGLSREEIKQKYNNNITRI